MAGYNKQVADQLAKLGVNTKLRETREAEERPKVNARVNRILTEMGMGYGDGDVDPGKRINEANPLDAPGAAPAVQPPTAGPAGQGAQDTPPAPNQPATMPKAKQKPEQNPSIKLKANSMGQANSMEDLAEMNAQMLAAIKPADLLIQSLSQGEDGEGGLEQNREALAAVYKPFFRKVDQIKMMLEPR